MSVWESVPTVADLASWSEEEVDEYLAETSRQIAEWHHVNAWHDHDGYYAKTAGSAECVALGHHEDEYDDPDTHPRSFDGEPLCLATRWGQCCTACEGDCQYNSGEPHGGSVWALPGVSAALTPEAGS